MLPEKRWSMGAVMRLGASVLTCMFLGNMTTALVRTFSERQHVNPWTLPCAVGAVVFLGVGLVILGRKWRPEHLIRNLLRLLACIYVGFALLVLVLYFVGAAKHPLMSSAPVDLIIGVLSLHGVGLVLIYRFAREHGKNWSDAFGFTSRWRGALFWGAFGAIASYAMIWFLQILISVILQRFRVEPHEQTVVDVLRHTTGWTQLIILGIATVLIVPPAEEMLFRGILYPAIKEAGFPRMAWWITSLLFGAIHMNAATFIPLTFLAVILIWLYEETGNLLAPIVTHAGFNAVNFAMLVWQEKFPHSP